MTGTSWDEPNLQKLLAKAEPNFAENSTFQRNFAGAGDFANLN